MTIVDSFAPLDLEMKDSLYCIRHSLAHLMAAAVMDLRPGSRLGFGPPVEDGFYYDFILSSPLTEEDFPAIEARMRAWIAEGHGFEREDLPRAEAFLRLKAMGEPYKEEYAQELFEQKSLSHLSFYRTGSFVDMCEGPHVATSAMLQKVGFQLRRLAGAYWRGDSRNVMMTRIYAWAFSTPEELEAHQKNFELAQQRDHKKLGRELEIFILDDAIGKGLPLWLPNGTAIRDELEKLMRELEFQAGYQRVVTPHLAKADLYYQTGHLPYYEKHMFPQMVLQGAEHEAQEVYCLKPMNCPHHHRIYASQLRSYRQLPLRLAEYGQVYRFEDSGALSGLLRVRGMCMNDAHIYCTQEQIKTEFLSVMEMHRQVYEILKIQDFYLRFSTWDPTDPKGHQKYVNQPEIWDLTQKWVHEALLESGLPFVEGKGEAAFYGPKVDFQFKTVTGREETASTNQLDFVVPQRLGLKFIGVDQKEHVPYVIHRAPMGTHERFVAFLIEHYGGAFPTWLAPIQVRILTVTDVFREYGEAILKTLRSHGIRAEMEHSSETFGKKIRAALQMKIPNLLIIGKQEQSTEKVTWRRYGHTEQQTMSVQEMLTILLKKIQRRSEHET